MSARRILLKCKLDYVSSLLKASNAFSSHLMLELKTKSLQCPTGPSVSCPIILLLFILILPLSSGHSITAPAPMASFLLLDTPSMRPPQSFCTCCSLCLDICRVNAVTSCKSFPLPILLTLFLALFFSTALSPSDKLVLFVYFLSLLIRKIPFPLVLCCFPSM